MSDPARPDAFKARMLAAQAELDRPELAHQSLARDLSDHEDALAEALMAIYGSGTSDPADVAAALSEGGTVRPSSGETDWTVETLNAELQALNADLDAAYARDGFGA